MTIELINDDDVRALLGKMWIPRIRGHRDLIAIRLPGITPSERLERELALNAAFQDCGCSAGAKFMVLGLVCTAAYQSVLHGALWRASGSELIRGSLIVLGFAVIGKIVGLVRAHLRLLADLRALRKPLHSSVAGAL